MTGVLRTALQALSGLVIVGLLATYVHGGGKPQESTQLFAAGVPQSDLPDWLSVKPRIIANNKDEADRSIKALSFLFTACPRFEYFGDLISSLVVDWHSNRDASVPEDYDWPQDVLIEVGFKQVRGSRLSTDGARHLSFWIGGGENPGIMLSQHPLASFLCALPAEGRRGNGYSLDPLRIPRGIFGSLSPAQ